MTIPTNKRRGTHTLAFSPCPRAAFLELPIASVVEVAASASHSLGNSTQQRAPAPGCGAAADELIGVVLERPYTRIAGPGIPATAWPLDRPPCSPPLGGGDVGRVPRAVAGSRGAVSPGWARPRYRNSSTDVRRSVAETGRPVARQRPGPIPRAGDRRNKTERSRYLPGGARPGSSHRALSCSGRGRRGSCLRLACTTRNPRALDGLPAVVRRLRWGDAGPELKSRSRAISARRIRTNFAATPANSSPPIVGPAPETPASHLRPEVQRDRRQSAIRGPASGRDSGHAEREFQLECNCGVYGV